MLRMITGLPGHNKTSNTLALFLEQKGKRPLYALNIAGFDYDKHSVGKLENLDELFSLPPRSLVFCDEAQKYLRPKGKNEKTPEWYHDFETHRHLGIDLWYTTQHPMFIDVHVRRLTDSHWHYFRPFGIQKATSVIEWTGVKDDPNDYHARQAGAQKLAEPPKWIFAEYTSTAADTTERRVPRKLLYAGVAVLIALGFIVYQASHFFDDDKPAETQLSPEIKQPSHSQSLQNGQMVGGHSKPLTIDDFKPIHPMLPWTAPVYEGSANIKAVPRFAGCMASKKGCDCVTQQGTHLEVDRELCVHVVFGKSRPFDPFHPDSPDYQPPAPDDGRVAVASGAIEPSPVADPPAP